jgi:hypothetical protein
MLISIPHWNLARGRAPNPHGYTRCRDPLTGERYYEHVAVAELVIGRPLLPAETVHHLNENTQDNRPGNLVVVPRDTHGRIHIKDFRRNRLGQLLPKRRRSK